MSHGGVLSRQTFWRDLATSKIFANFTINDDRRKQALQTTQPQNKTVNRNDSYFTQKKYQSDAICPGNSRTVKDALIKTHLLCILRVFIDEKAI
jgi:hypothetical protein